MPFSVWWEVVLMVLGGRGGGGSAESSSLQEGSETIAERFAVQTDI